MNHMVTELEIQLFISLCQMTYAYERSNPNVGRGPSVDSVMYETAHAHNIELLSGQHVRIGLAIGEWIAKYG